MEEILKYAFWIIVVAGLVAVAIFIKLLKTGRACLRFLWISRTDKKDGRKKLGAKYIRDLRNWFVAEIFFLLVIVVVAALKGWIF